MGLALDMAMPRTMDAPRVTILHGHADRASALAGTLALWGFHCFPAQSGEQVLEDAANAPPSAVVLDLDVPRTDALAIAAALKAHRPTRNVRVLGLLAGAGEDGVELALARGCDAVIQGAADPDEVAARIEALTHRTRRRVA